MNSEKTSGPGVVGWLAGAALVVLLAGGAWFLASDWPPDRPGPAFEDGWDEATAAREPTPLQQALAGPWDAYVTDGDEEMRANGSVLEFQFADSGDVRVHARAHDGSWNSWGRGRLEGRGIWFEWTGPKGWYGTARLELSADGNKLSGRFQREGVELEEYAVAERR
jgi:hypothetical protein